MDFKSYWIATALRNVNHGNSNFVAVGDLSIMLNSSDAITWTENDSVSVTIRGVTYSK